MKNQTKTILIIIALLPLIVCSMYQLHVANSIVIDGKKLYEVEKKITHYERENNLLSLEVVKYGTISSVNERAEKIGLEPAKVLFLTQKSKNLAFK